MPVTTRPSPSTVGKNRDTEIEDSTTIFDVVTSNLRSPYLRDPRRPVANAPSYRQTGFRGLRTIASSFRHKTAMSSARDPISVYNNGFVNGLIRAFNQDLHLCIRPDDVWQAILSQFSLFINGNAERMRHLFVAHKGKTVLGVDMTPQRISEIDFGRVAEMFVSVIQDNVVDKELRQWMMPDFSTTTNHDKAVAAFGIMGAMQQYFSYECRGGCGLPSVTLLGTRDDWERLASRVSKLGKYGKECQHWASLLQPVMRYMLKTFDEPDSHKVKDFWLRVAYEAGKEGSSPGVRTLSGWITAFAYFKMDGTVARDYDENEIRRMDENDPEPNRKRLVLDGVSYPLIRSSEIPAGVILLPITVIDEEKGVKRFATAVSGTIGMSISANGTTTQPVSAWWVVQEFIEPMNSSTTT
ncbi:hypothetical protein F5Y03DRAFT_403287 [Xylaria venustula]|nr:hypothetical protein F5Y03DRAFT_403287 [Xylaria venustula]